MKQQLYDLLRSAYPYRDLSNCFGIEARPGMVRRLKTFSSPMQQDVLQIATKETRRGRSPILRQHFTNPSWRTGKLELDYSLPMLARLLLGHGKRSHPTDVFRRPDADGPVIKRESYRTAIRISHGLRNCGSTAAFALKAEGQMA